MHHQRSSNPIPRSQDWACGPSAFLYIPKDYLLDYFSRKFYDNVKLYFSKIIKYRRSGNFRVKNISCVKISWR